MRNLRNAIGYIRVSTEGQANDDKYGIEVQRKEILAYADANDYSIVSWKIDTMSGTSDDRPALNEVLYGGVSNPPFEAVIIFKNDRIARDTKLYFYYLYTLEKKNIKLLSTKEEFNEGSDFANIYRALLQFVAEQERKNIAIRTGKGRSMKAACGGYSGGRAPYGYKVEHGQLKVVEQEAEIVKLIFDEYDNNGTAMLNIVPILRQKGYTTRKGSDFQVSTIRSILNNRRTYQGYYHYGNGPWVKGVHEPILKEGE